MPSPRRVPYWRAIMGTQPPQLSKFALSFWAWLAGRGPVVGLLLICSGVLIGLAASATLVTTVIVAVIPIAIHIGLRQRGFARGLALKKLSSRASCETASQAELRELLAKLLGDPSVEIVYWLQEKNRFVTECGQEFDAAAEARNRVVHPIDDLNECVGAVVYSSNANDRSDLLGAAECDIGPAMRDSRLEAELRAEIAEISSSRLRLLASADEKQRRIERDLHDGAQQGLVSIALDLALTANDPAIDERSRAALVRSAAALTTITEELRELARGVHPAILSDGGLDGAIKSLADRCPIPTKIRGSCDENLPRAVESAAYFVVAEALTNIARGSHAANVEISVTIADSKLALIVSDDGCGGADPSKGTGLHGLADRVDAVGGKFAIESPQGGGTRIFVELPVLREILDQLGELNEAPSAAALKAHTTSLSSV